MGNLGENLGDLADAIGRAEALREEMGQQEQAQAERRDSSQNPRQEN